MASELEKSQRINRLLLLLLIIVTTYFFYHEPAEKREHITEAERIAKIQFETEAKRCLAEEVAEAAAKVAAKDTAKVAAAEATEKARLQALQIKVVTDFYQAVKEHDCKTATELRVDYTEEDCLNTIFVELKEADIVKEIPSKTVIQLEIVYQKEGKRKKSFSGFLQLAKQDGQWVILGKYSSQDNLDEYLEKHKMIIASN